MITMSPYRTFPLALLLAAATAPFSAALPVLGAPVRTDVSLARGWQHVLMSGPRLPAQGLTRVVAGGPGLVAFAQGVPTGLWSSADGRTWRSLPSPAFRQGEQPIWFYAAGRILVLTGSASGQPRIWASHDAGSTWHESPAHLRITALAAGGDGAVAFSQADPSQPTSVLTSADGLRWRQLPQKSGVFASAQVFSVARGAHVLVAGGYIGSPRQRAAIWTSADGRTWTQLTNKGGVFGNGSDGSQVNYVVAGPRGMLAIGQRLQRATGAGPMGLLKPVAWASPDGMHWQRRALPFNDPNEYFGQVAAWQEGFVQFTDEGGEAAVWSSSDGLTWTRLGSDELFGGSARVWSVAALQGGLVAVGSFALHPQPACPRSPNLGFGDLRTFRPASFRWSPDAAMSAPPPTIDASDPRALKLLPSDGVGGLGGAYVNLCAADPALGRHRAYLLFFDDPHKEIVHGTGISGTALSIVTENASASSAAFRSVGQLLIPSATIQHQRELPVGVPIGEETRVFRLKVLETEEGDHNLFTEFAVAWRKGQVIGVIVVPATRHEAVLLAERQLAHLEHPLG